MASFFFNDTATTEIYTLSLHDALPILRPEFSALKRVDPIANEASDAHVAMLIACTGRMVRLTSNYERRAEHCPNRRLAGGHRPSRCSNGAHGRPGAHGNRASGHWWSHQANDERASVEAAGCIADHGRSARTPSILQAG